MILQSKNIHDCPLGMLAVKNSVLLMKNFCPKPLLEQVYYPLLLLPLLLHSSVPEVLWASSALQPGPPFLLLCGSLHFQSIFAEHILYLYWCTRVRWWESFSSSLGNPSTNVKCCCFFASVWFPVSSKPLEKGGWGLIFGGSNPVSFLLKHCRRDGQWVLLKARLLLFLFAYRKNCV